MKKKCTENKNILATYVEEVKSYKLLTAEEEKELARKIALGDKKAKNQLINSNLRLVISIAKRYVSNTVCIMDLIQEGNLGLMTAAEKFDASFKTRFSTYAYAWILQFMQRYLRSKKSVIHIPCNQIELLKKVEVAQNILFHKNKYAPSSREIAQYLDLPEKTVNNVLTMPWNVLSLDSPYSNDDDCSIRDFIPDAKSNSEECIINKLHNEEVKTAMTNLLKNLTKREREVITYRYNFSVGSLKTLHEIGQILGISTETVRQTEKRAITHIKKIVANAPLEQIETFTA